MGSAIGTPVPVLVARIDDFLLPDDREELLNTLEKLQRRVGSILGKQTTSQAFVTANGVTVVVKVLKAMIKDDVVCRIAVAIFDYQREFPLAMTELIKANGMALLDGVLAAHPHDSQLGTVVPVLQRYVRAAGAGAAVKEINNEALSLQLCETCQQAVAKMQRAQHTHGNSTQRDTETERDAAKLRSIDRVQRVLMFVANYPTRKTVVLAGMNALLYFSANAHVDREIQESQLAATLLRTASEFSVDSEIIWRVATICGNLAHLGGNLSYDIVKTGVHDVLCKAFTNIGEPRVKQQILWYFDKIINFSKCRSTLNMSEAVMTLLRINIEEKNKLNIKNKFYPSKDKYEMYRFIIPYGLKEFYRETEGKVLIPPPEFPAPESNAYKPRKQFEKAPMYGTVDTKIFNDSTKEQGLKYKLVDDNPDEYKLLEQFEATDKLPLPNGHDS